MKLSSGDLRPLSMANRFAFVQDARAARREAGCLRRLRDEWVREAAQHRRVMRRRIERRLKSIAINPDRV